MRIYNYPLVYVITKYVYKTERFYVQCQFLFIKGFTESWQTKGHLYAELSFNNHSKSDVITTQYTQARIYPDTHKHTALRYTHHLIYIHLHTE